MLALVSIGPPVLAQSGDPDVKVDTALNASIPGDICLGEIGSIKVWAVRTLTEIATQWQVHIHRKGIIVFAASKDPGIVSVLQPAIAIGFGSNVPGEGKVEIRAEKVGATSITFKAPVSRLVGEVLINDARSSDDYVDLTVAVKVIPCNFEFSAHSDFETTGMVVHAVINRLVLTPDAQGQYNHTATVHWTASWMAPCKSVFGAPDSAANLTGEIDANGVLALVVSYQVSSGTWHTDCGGPIKSDDPLKLNPGNVTIYVPVSAELVEKTLRQDIEQIEGQAVLAVAPQHSGGGQ